MEILKYVQKKNLGVIGGFLSKVDPAPFRFFSRFILSLLNHRLISLLVRFGEIFVFWVRWVFSHIGTAQLCTGALVFNFNNVFGTPIVS
jgi:hypothetical protein